MVNNHQFTCCMFILERFVTICLMQAELLLQNIGIQGDHATANTRKLSSKTLERLSIKVSSTSTTAHARMIRSFQGHRLGNLVFPSFQVTALWPHSIQVSIDLLKILKQCWQLSTWSGTDTSERSTKFRDIDLPQRR